MNVTDFLPGDVIRWEQQVRFRHMTTRQYLCLNADMHICLTPDDRDPNTVFRLHPIVKVAIASYFCTLLSCLFISTHPGHTFIPFQEADEIQFESYARIEHVLSGFWLHALRGLVMLRSSRYIYPLPIITVGD